MLNFFQISLTSSCNLSCWHCPMAKYRNTDNDKFKLTNARLVPWIRKNLSPRDWIIELTGGEPSLYDGINQLCSWLSSNKYRTLVKTNGKIPIQKFPNVVRVAAFHQLDNPPVSFDQILIVDTVQSEEKVKYCEKMGWQYRVIGFNDDCLPDEEHNFKLCGFMDPHGHPVGCKARPVQYTEWPDKYALEFTTLKSTICCPHCKAAKDAWIFMPNSWKE